MRCETPYHHGHRQGPGTHGNNSARRPDSYSLHRPDSYSCRRPDSDSHLHPGSYSRPRPDSYSRPRLDRYSRRPDGDSDGALPGRLRR